MESSAPEEPVESPEVPRETSGEYEPETSLPEWLAGLDKERSAEAGTEGAGQPPPWMSMEETPMSDQAPVTAAGEWRQAESNSEPESTFEPEPASEPSPPSAAEPTSEVQPVSALEARHPEGSPREEVEKPMPPPAADKGPLPKVQKQTATLLGNAQSEMGRGNIAAALEIYGRLIHKGKSLTETIRDLRDALYRYPVEVPIWQALGDAYMRANRLQEALDAYTKAEELLR
jgi:hypothetical protein